MSEYDRVCIDIKVDKLIKAACGRCDSIDYDSLRYAILKLTERYNECCDPIVLVESTQ